MDGEFENPKDGFCLPSILTMSTANETMRSYLEAAPIARGTIDASGVETIDLVGMQLMIALLREETGHGFPRLFKPSVPVAQAFERAGAPLPQTP